MKNEEDEAFDELTRKQGEWGGGFKAKKAMAADKLQEPVLDLDGHVVRDARKPKKAALAQPAQEPVAWMTINAYDDEDDIWYENPEGKLLEGWTYKPLYTYPPTVQPEKEPLEYWNAVEGWVKIDEVREHFDSVGCGTIYKTAGEDRTPVYTTSQKRPWIGLTDEEIDSVFQISAYQTEPIKRFSPERFALAIEAKLKERNHGT